LQGSERIEMRLHQQPTDTTAIAQLPGVVSVSVESDGLLHIETAAGSELRPQLASLVVNQGWGLLELHKVTLSLETIFLELTTQEEPTSDHDGVVTVDAPPTVTTTDEGAA
jgi:hypothetical protein